MSAVEQASEAPRMRILVVDDSSLVRLYYRNALRGGGLQRRAGHQRHRSHGEGARACLRPGDRRRQHAENGRLVASCARSGAAAPDVATLPSLVIISTESGEQDHRRCQRLRARISIWSSRFRIRTSLRHVAALTGSAGMNALHEQFIAEARELIHQATDDLIAIEREGCPLERIDRDLSCLPHAQGFRRGGRAAGDESDTCMPRKTCSPRSMPELDASLGHR